MKNVVCIDLGGTKALAARVDGVNLSAPIRRPVPCQGEKEQINAFVLELVRSTIDEHSQGIAIGVPSMVEMQSGRVLETVNIPSWHNVALQQLLQTHFELPVVVHNDANCFAMGEYCYGGHQVQNLVGVCLGTGLGAGIVIDGTLYSGKHAAAGEFGSFPYRDGIIEHYTSGQFFKRQGLEGGEQALLAQQGDAYAKALFTELGTHIGYALAQVMLAFDPDKVVLGGSVARSYSLFAETMRHALSKQAHPILVEALQLSPGQLEYAPLLGAYALFERHTHLPHKEVYCA
ncbi:ROK family protein [Pseudoalteromonas ruthenica]|uniref:ROK family protein n=1 Tax=Pseudoalteromonas ruthenica TaxID=151081 RepID=UPI00241E43F5|nr:ROK family protein [Pseudoalteromonas ruthenica]|tara:strand:+ start:52261 stop:53127 length:867 start_codon:yes stop_codon:yes gene_type:complete